MCKNGKIILKDKWGFWFFKRHSFIIEDIDQSLTELHVNEETWNKYNVGDQYLLECK